MHYHPQEIAQWEPLKDLLAPDGVVDDDAVRLYLAQYARLQLKKTYPSDTDGTALGAVLKRASLDSIGSTFPVFYSKFRLHQLNEYGANESVSLDYIAFDDWLQDMAAGRPNDLEVLLRQAAGVLDFTHQAMVLRDAKKWLPESDMTSYIPPELLKKRPASLFKDFSPAPKDIPYLVEVGAALVEKGLSQKHLELGDTLLRSCFFACYKERRESYNPNLYQFDSPKAFGLIENHAPIDDYEKLIGQLFVRIKEPTAVWDALGYCVQVLQDPDAPEKKKTRAEGIAAAVLNAEFDREHNTRFQHTAVHALGAIYNATKNLDLRTAIVDFFDSRMHGSARSLLREILDALPETAPDLLDAIMERMKAKQPPATWQTVTTMLITGLDMEVATSYRVELPCAEAGQFVFNKLSGQQLLVHLHEALASCGDDSAKLEELLDGLSTKAWSPDQKEVMRNDVWTPTLVMLYLYSRARSPDTTTSLASAALPNTGWQPLPLLAKLYPEHAPLWRSMQLGILGLEPQSSGGPENHAAPDRMQALMHHFFEMFSKSFSSGATNINACRGVIEGLGIAPMDYFINHVHASPTTFELPDNMFDLA